MISTVVSLCFCATPAVVARPPLVYSIQGIPFSPGCRNTVPAKDPMMSSHFIAHAKIPTLVFPTSQQASRHVALMIESLIRQNNSANRPTVLGLATGSTPVGLYRELIRSE